MEVRTAGRGAAWQRASFGTMRSRVRISPPRPSCPEAQAPPRIVGGCAMAPFATVGHRQRSSCRNIDVVMSTTAVVAGAAISRRPAAPCVPASCVVGTRGLRRACVPALLALVAILSTACVLPVSRIPLRLAWPAAVSAGRWIPLPPPRRLPMRSQVPVSSPTPAVGYSADPAESVEQRIAEAWLTARPGNLRCLPNAARRPMSRRR